MFGIPRKFMQLSLVLVLLVTMGALWSTRFTQVVATDTAAEAALPTAAEMAGFGKAKMESGGRKDSLTLRAKRLSDKAEIAVTTGACSSEEEAHKLVLMRLSSYGLMPLPGSLSGRVIGDECWHSRYQPGQPPTSDFEIIARDGRAVTIVSLDLVIDKGPRGNAVPRKLTPGDLNLVEMHTIKALGKLAKMGYTSGGPVVQAAKAAQRARR